MRITIPTSTMLSALILVLLLVPGSGGLLAQRWQYEYGGSTCLEFGTKGVMPVSTGGYIAAGASHSTAIGCNERDVYVVRTNDDGSLAWSFTYNIDNQLSGATCVQECANGDFIVTGSTGPGATCCCQPSNIFLMRLRPDGSVIWVRSYGTERRESASSVIEMTTGDSILTSPGDLVVCGSMLGDDGQSRGYMIRTTAGGRLIWDKTYAVELSQTIPNPPVYYSTNELSDVEEAVHHTPGTILVVGTIATTAPGSSKAMLMRVYGHDGSPYNDIKIWSAPGVPTTGSSLVELTGNAQGTSAGDVVVTGTIMQGGIPNAYTARFRAFGCNALAEGYYLSGYTSMGNDIQEMANGNLVVAGEVNAPPYTSGAASDAMLIEIKPDDLTCTGSKINIFGDADGESGSSVMEVAASGSRTAGFVMAGTSAGQLYMVKTDTRGSSSCSSNPVDRDDLRVPGFVVGCKGVTTSSWNQWCTPSWTADRRIWESKLCYLTNGIRDNGNPGEGTTGGGTSSVPVEEGSGPVFSISNDADMTSYPNPVRKGSAFRLEYTLSRSGPVTIDVVDVSGRVVYSRSEEYPAGAGLIPVETEGWPSGSYLVKLSTSGAAASQRVTVVDR